MKNFVQLKVFVLDDDIMYNKMLVSYLQSLGHQAVSFETTNECLLNLHHNPDVILLDHNLDSEQKGVDVLRFIKMERPDISVIYITGEENIALVSDVFRSGSEDFIGKDSASLLRLKLKLSDLMLRKVETAYKKKRTRRILVAGAVVFTCFLILQYLLMR